MKRKPAAVRMEERQIDRRICDRSHEPSLPLHSGSEDVEEKQRVLDKRRVIAG